MSALATAGGVSPRFITSKLAIGGLFLRESIQKQAAQLLCDRTPLLLGMILRTRPYSIWVKL
jgi:hypothetical protein